MGPKPGAHWCCRRMDRHSSLLSLLRRKCSQSGHWTERTASAASIRQAMSGIPYRTSFYWYGSHGSYQKLRGTTGLQKSRFTFLHSKGSTYLGRIRSVIRSGILRITGRAPESFRLRTWNHLISRNTGRFGTRHQFYPFIYRTRSYQWLLRTGMGQERYLQLYTGIGAIAYHRRRMARSIRRCISRCKTVTVRIRLWTASIGSLVARPTLCATGIPGLPPALLYRYHPYSKRNSGWNSQLYVP